MDDVIKIFAGTFKLRVPSEAGQKLDFRTAIPDILYAQEEFNSKFEGFKEMKITGVGEQEINFLFSISVETDDVSVNARDLTVFSKRLYHCRGWNQYSRENARLLTATRFEELEDYEEEFCRLPDYPPDLLEVSEGLSETINQQISDDQAVKALQSLINILDIGSEETQQRRKKSIVDIKRILLASLS